MTDKLKEIIADLNAQLHTECAAWAESAVPLVLSPRVREAVVAEVLAIHERIHNARTELLLTGKLTLP